MRQRRHFQILLKVDQGQTLPIHQTNSQVQLPSMINIKHNGNVSIDNIDKFRDYFEITLKCTKTKFDPVSYFSKLSSNSFAASNSAR